MSHLRADIERGVEGASRAEHRVIGLGAAAVALYLSTMLFELAISRDDIGGLASIADPGYPANAKLVTEQVALHTVLTVSIFWIYGSVISMSRRGELDSGRARLWALTIPIALNLVLIPWLPRLSQDAFSYLAHGYLGAFPGKNPLVQSPDDALDTPFGPHLSAFGWHSFRTVTPYGILWTRLEVAVATLCGGNVFAGIVLLKFIVVAASLGTGRLIWLVLGRIHPRLQLHGTLAYLWNPLVLVEFAGEGHNDAVMIFFSAAALMACIAARPAASIVAQFLGVISKYVCILFLPAQLIFLWRTRRSAARLAVEIVIGLAISIVIVIVLYAHLWVGVHSFDGVLHRAGAANERTFYGLAHALIIHTPLASRVGPLTTVLVIVPLLVIVIWNSLRVRDAADLARACAWSSLGFVLMTSPDYWPWYACLPIAWICIAAPERLFWLAALMSLAGRLIGPLEALRIHNHLEWHFIRGLTGGIGAFLPLVALVTWCWLHSGLWPGRPVEPAR
jgi:alpha-1,6-mannosyltransferase